VYSEKQLTALRCFGVIVLLLAGWRAGQSELVARPAPLATADVRHQLHPLADDGPRGKRQGQTTLLFSGPAGPVRVERLDPFPTQIDINTATVRELATLPGVGEGLAQRITQWRDQHGAFTSIASLDDVPGIGPKFLERTSGLLTVGEERR